MQANIFKVHVDKTKGSFDMSHLCSYMNSKEQDAEQDFRIMSGALVTSNNNFYAIFGTSNGELSTFFINTTKRRFEEHHRI
jgi:hypothetical protein